MIKLLSNTDNTIGIGQVQEGDQYEKVIKIGYEVLKDLVKMMGAYDTEEGFELGTIIGKNGDKALVFLQGDNKVGFLVAGLYDPAEDISQKKLIPEEIGEEIL